MIAAYATDDCGYKSKDSFPACVLIFYWCITNYHKQQLKTAAFIISGQKAGVARLNSPLIVSPGCHQGVGHTVLLFGGTRKEPIHKLI